jgi:coenzyme F420-reducing hydrogenase beta subunit
VQDNIITKDGRFFGFKYIDYLDEVITLGCMVCPSFIVCKQADVSIGVTASETKLNEFGYNSVMVRSPGLSAVFSDMEKEQTLLKRPMWDNRGTLLRKFVERVLPSKDLMNFAEYVRTGSWKPHDDLYKRSESVQGGKILGLQRLLVAQTVKRKMMHEPAVRALQKEGKHYPDMI